MQKRGMPDKATGVDKHPLDTLFPPLVHIPAGPFIMGDDNDLLDIHKPQHTVTLPEFWIGQTQVTFAQFNLFVESDGYTNKSYWTEKGWEWRCKKRAKGPGRQFKHYLKRVPSRPVMSICWFEAIAYVRWLSTRVGVQLRLPTEAEWEKAARGANGRTWPWGNEKSIRPSAFRVIMAMEKLVRDNSYYDPKLASPYGVYGMASRIGDWCSTRALPVQPRWLTNFNFALRARPYPYRLDDEWDPTYLEGDLPRIVRGTAYDLKCVTRMAYNPEHGDEFISLRLVSPVSLS